MAEAGIVTAAAVAEPVKLEAATYVLQPRDRPVSLTDIGNQRGSLAA